MKDKAKYVRWGLTALLVGCALLIFYDVFYRDNAGTVQAFFGKLWSILAPVLYGLAMAYLLAPLVNHLERWILRAKDALEKKRGRSAPVRRGLLRAVSILLTWAVVLVVLYLLFAMLIPQLVDSVTTLISNLETYYNQIYAWVTNLLEKNPIVSTWLSDLVNRYYSEATNWLTTELLPGLQATLTSFTGSLVTGVWSVITFAKNFIIGIIISVYLLAAKEKSLARCCKVIYATFRRETADLVLTGLHNTNRVFSGFVRGKLLDSLIIGILCFIGCSILKMPYTPLVSVVVGVTNVIPFFGPFLGAIPSAFLILLASPLKCLYFVIFVVLLQQLDGNVIGPKILGDSTGISSFWVIVAILVGGGFFGVPGMFFGVPVFACLRMLVKWLMDRRLARRGMPTEASAYVERKEALQRERAPEKEPEAERK